MSIWSDNEKKVDEAVALFPPAFGLRAYKGRLFRVERATSYFTFLDKKTGQGTQAEGYVMLYTSVLATEGTQKGAWLGFVRGTVEELKREIVCVECRRRAGTKLDPESNEYNGRALNAEGLCFDCYS